MISEGKMKYIYVYWNQSPEQIHQFIVQELGINDYTILDCNGKRHILTIAAEESIDGNSLKVLIFVKQQQMYV